MHILRSFEYQLTNIFKIFLQNVILLRSYFTGRRSYSPAPLIVVYEELCSAAVVETAAISDGVDQ